MGPPFIIFGKMSRTYHTFNVPASLTDGGLGKTLLTGIRPVKDHKGQVLITAFYTPTTEGSPIVSFLFVGNPKRDAEKAAHWHPLNYPSTPGMTITSTSLYGPDNGRRQGHVSVVGNATSAQQGAAAIGCIFQGALENASNPLAWSVIAPTPLLKEGETLLNTIVHSNNGGIAVGNFDSNLIQGRGFIYHIKSKRYVEITHQDAKSITAYGVWKDGDGQYTISGGYTDLKLGPRGTGLDSAYLVRYSKKRGFYNWTPYSFDNDQVNSIVTHFDGISKGRDHKGRRRYTLTGDAVVRTDVVGQFPQEKAFFATVSIRRNGKLSKRAKWSTVAYPGATGTSGNSVSDHIVIGVYSLDSKVNGYISN